MLFVVVVVTKWSAFISFVRSLFKLEFDIAKEWKSVSWNRIVQMPWHQKSEFIIINILLLFIRVITMCMMNYDVYFQSEPQQSGGKKNGKNWRDGIGNFNKWEEKTAAQELAK